MNCSTSLLRAAAAGLSVAALGNPAFAADFQLGASGKTYASAAVQCAMRPDTGTRAAMVEAGLFNPKRGASASVSLNGAVLGTVTTASPSTTVWLPDGDNTLVVALSKKTADSYAFTVAADRCALPDTSGNTFSADGTLEYGASGKSSATVTPGCALNASTGRAQPYVHVFDIGGYLLNVSVNGIPLTQLSTTHPNTPVFLGAGMNVISVAYGRISTDYFVRDGGDGSCVLPQ